jgi:putative tricarboxylic transport membrane protein
MLRRSFIGGIAPLTWAALPTLAFAQEAVPPAPMDALSIFIPGGAGGGWDQTGRSLGEAMVQAGMARKVSYENKGGKGGTIGLAEFVQRYNTNPSALFVGGMVLVGAISVNRPSVNLKQVVPLARLTSDYMVLVVPADSPFSSMADLVAAMRKDLGRITFTGGSVGGVDHMLAAMVAGATISAGPSPMSLIGVKSRSVS